MKDDYKTYGLDDILSSIKKAKENEDIKGIYIRQAAQRAHLLAHNHVVLLHETVALRKHRQHVLIKLYAQQHNHHTAQVGQEESCQLRHTDVLPQ